MVDISFSKPTLATLISQAEANFNTRIPGADARLRNSVLNTMARVVAGQSHLLHNYLDWIARQAIPDTADAENLDNWGSVWGVTRIAASKAAGNVTFTGTDGVTVPTGTELQRADGILFVTTADVTISGSTGTAAAEARLGGLNGNTAAGVTVNMISPVAGVNSAAVAAAGGLVGGLDAETDEAYRARILARIQAPPHGGSKTDYEQWALGVAGVTRAWVYPIELGRGTVTVRFVRDNNTTPTPQNLLTFSEDFSQAAWVKTSTGVSPGGAVHPTASDVYTLATNVADSIVRQQVPIWEAGTYVFSLEGFGLGGARTFDLRIFAADGTTQLAAQSVTAPDGAWGALSVSADVTGGSSIWVQIGGGSTFSTGEDIAVTRAQVRRSTQPATYIKANADSIIGSLIIPTPTDVANVLAYIADDTRAPVTADVFVAAPIAKRLDITVTGLSPNTAAVRAAVLAELEDLFRRDSEPGGTMRVSRIWEAVSIASGESFHRITSPSVDQTAATGRMWVLGTVTFA
jgi:uncharacterized phage protein gp47/JayE